MKQYVSRRRCWTLLTQMDPVIHLSEGHRSNMLLDLRGLTREERVMVQASSNNELATAAYPGVCDGRSVWMADCRELDDPDCDEKPGIHVGRNPRIMRSTIRSKDYHELHSRLYDGMSRFLSGKNVVIMICKNGRRRPVLNAELWSNTLTRYGRLQHSVSLLHLSELDFWKDTCAGKCSECSKQSARIFQTHYDCVRAEYSRLLSASDSVN